MVLDASRCGSQLNKTTIMMIWTVPSSGHPQRGRSPFTARAKRPYTQRFVRLADVLDEPAHPPGLGRLRGARRRPGRGQQRRQLAEPGAPPGRGRCTGNGPSEERPRRTDLERHERSQRTGRPVGRAHGRPAPHQALHLRPVVPHPAGDLRGTSAELHGSEVGADRVRIRIEEPVAGVTAFPIKQLASVVRIPR